MSLPARLAPPGGQGRVVGVRVAAPANEMQVCWSLSGAARVGWLRCVRVCSLKLCRGMRRAVAVSQKRRRPEAPSSGRRLR